MGNAAFGGQIQVPDVHSFTMSQTKKVVLDGFSTGRDKTRKRIRNAERNDGSGLWKRIPLAESANEDKTRIPLPESANEDKTRIPPPEFANKDKTRIPPPESANGDKTRNCVKMIKKRIKTQMKKLTLLTVLLNG